MTTLAVGPDAATDSVIATLNRLHQADPTVLPSLIATRVTCNEAIANDPTIQVEEVSDDCDPPHIGHRVGFLGILNGVFGVDEDGWGPIAAWYNAAGDLVRFERTGAESSSDRTDNA